MTFEEQEFKSWHDQYQPRLLTSMTKLVRDRDTAEDVTATALATMWKQRQHFRGEASLWTWVYRIAMNEASSARRRRSMISIDACDESEMAFSESDGLVKALEHDEQRRKLQRAIRRVPEVYRRVLLEHFVHGYALREIAQRLAIPYGTVLSRMFKAKQLLRAAWDA